MKAQVMFPVHRDNISKDTSVDMRVHTWACVHQKLSAALIVVTLLTFWLLEATITQLLV